MNRVVIDVREPVEFEAGHADGAINIPPAMLLKGEPEELKDLSRDVQLIVYCRTGARSNAAIPYLQSFGFTHITNGINQDHVKQNYS